MSIYRWAKLDDQSGPDRSIELKGSGQVRDHRCGHTETALARRSGADDVLACVVALALCGVQIHRRLDSIGVLRWTPHNSRGHITHTAPTVDEWRRNKRPGRIPSSPWDMRWPHCVGRMWVCRAFSLVSGLPSRLSAVGCPSLFEPFIGTTPKSDS